MKTTSKPTPQQASDKNEKLVIRTQLKAGNMGSYVVSPYGVSQPGYNMGEFSTQGGGMPDPTQMHP